MAKLIRLKINQFRNVEPVELRFANGSNVLLGMNASGKTTLLDLITALASQDVSPFRDEPFSVAYTLAFATGTIEVELENEQVQHDNGDKAAGRRRMHRSAKGDHALRARVRVDFPSSPAEYLIEADQSSTAEVARSRVSGKESKSEYATPGRFDENILGSMMEPLYELEEWDETKGVGPALTILDELINLVRFDESLDFFLDFILDEDGWLRLLGRVDAPETGPEQIYAGYPLPKVVMAALEELSKGTWPSWQESEMLRIPADKLPFLASMVRLAGLKDGNLELRLVKKRAGKGNNSERMYLDFGNFRFWLERVDGSIVAEQKLSYGQKRLLSFLYYVDCNSHIVIADELANGLHHAWITACIEAIGDRQAFLASQNPLLLDELDLDSVEEVLQSFILCRCDTTSGKERLVWSNMSRYDAERFFDAYKVGLQHVSEILRTKGLW